MTLADLPPLFDSPAKKKNLFIASFVSVCLMRGNRAYEYAVSLLASFLLKLAGQLEFPDIVKSLDVPASIGKVSPVTVTGMPSKARAVDSDLHLQTHE